MPLYKIEPESKSLQPFHATALGELHGESSLEDWLEKTPEVLLSDEPLLIIGRQVNTRVGVLDLLALDSSGSGVIIELKRAPSQREAVGQSLEYASWLSSVTPSELQEIADCYFKKNSSALTMASAWEETFGVEYKSSQINSAQRVFVVIEGENERMFSLVNYLRSTGVDISLYTYDFYRSDSGEEMLNIQLEIGDTEPTQKDSIKPSEEKHIDDWTARISDTYEAFRDRLLDAGLYTKPKKSGMSFLVQTEKWPVFVCFFSESSSGASLWLRSDSMSSTINFKKAADAIRGSLPDGSSVKHTDVWYMISFPPKVENAKRVADIVLNEVVTPVLAAMNEKDAQLSPDPARGAKTN